MGLEKVVKIRRSSRGTPLQQQKQKTNKENETIKKRSKKESNQIEKEKLEKEVKVRRSSRGTPLQQQKQKTNKENETKEISEKKNNQLENEELEKVVKSRRTSRRSKRQALVVDENQINAKRLRHII